MRIIAAPAPVSLWGFTLESGSGPVVDVALAEHEAFERVAKKGQLWPRA